MNFSTNFFKTTSVCAIIAGILVLILWLLQFAYAAPATLEDEIALQDNAVYTTSAWFHLAALFFALVALWGAAAMKMDSAAGLATTGFIFVLFDFLPGAVMNSMGIFTFNYNWAARYAAEETAADVKSMLMTNMSGFYDAYGGIIFVGLVSFLIASFLYGLATARGAGIEKVVSLFFFLIFISLLLLAVGMYGAQTWLTELVRWIVPLIWAALLFLIGAWLWKGKEAF